MDVLIYLIPAVLFTSVLALGALIWSIRSGQFEDLEGESHRVLFDDWDEKPRP